MAMRDEILQQPERLEALLCDGPAEAAAIARSIAGRFQHVVVAARGSSDNAARYAQYLWGIHNRLVVTLAAPSIFSRYGARPSLEGALVVAVSQSGQSPDLIEVVSAAAGQGAPTIAITNDVHSPLAGVSDFVMWMRAGEERAVAATKTYTASLTAVALLSDAMDPGAGLVDDLRRVPAAVAAALDDEDHVAEVAAALAAETACAVLGRGYHYATAFEWALKLEELAYIVAQPHSTADFEHGPRAMVGAGFPVLAAVADGPLFAEAAALLEDLRVDRRATTVAITNRGDLGATHLLRIDADIAERCAPIVGIVPAQLFSHHIAIAKGHDPDNPRGLEKVTRTR
ncbi:MAG TPA: SIS domain-containing protein [Acidimicrobiia bacterium]